MNCTDAQRLADAYVDDELDLTAAVDLEAHIAACDACAALVGRIKELRRTIREHAPYYDAPAGLRQRFAARATSETTALPPARSRGFWPWLTLAASIVAVTSTAMLVRRAPGANEVQDAVVAAHIHSQMASHLTDVLSTDRHTVKPWLSARLDFSAPVPDLAAEGYPLVGGRLDYVERHTAAALVYTRRQHVINVFIWPEVAADAAPAHAEDPRGYHLVYWRARGLSFWASSDLAAGELEAFAKSFAASASGNP